MHRSRIERAAHKKVFLGITVDDKLNWKEHVNYISEKKSKSNGIINRLKTLLPKSALLTLYNTLVLPHLNYSLLLWGHTYKRLFLIIDIYCKNELSVIFAMQITFPTLHLFSMNLKFSLSSIYTIIN